MNYTINTHISQLLFDHECVVIPNFGSFLTRFYASEINTATHMMRPPSKRVHFNASILENDGLLAKHISRVEHISYTEAMEKIAQEIALWKQVLDNGKKVFLVGVGRLYLDKNQSLQFNPAIDINYDKSSFGLQIFRSPQIQREAEVTKTIQKAIEISLPKKKKEKATKKSAIAFMPWAAVVAPLIGLGIAAGVYFNQPERINNLSGLPPFLGPSSSQVIEEKESPLNNEIAKEVSSPVKITTPTVETKKEVTSAKTNVSPIKPTTQSAFHIVVGSFKEAKNAEQYVQTLKGKGFDAYITPQKQNFTRVSIGHYANVKEAQIALINVKRDVNASSWIYAN